MWSRSFFVFLKNVLTGHTDKSRTLLELLWPVLDPSVLYDCLKDWRRVKGKGGVCERTHTENVMLKILLPQGSWSILHSFSDLNFQSHRPHASLDEIQCPSYPYHYSCMWFSKSLFRWHSNPTLPLNWLPMKRQPNPTLEPSDPVSKVDLSKDLMKGGI